MHLVLRDQIISRNKHGSNNPPKTNYDGSENSLRVCLEVKGKGFEMQFNNEADITLSQAPHEFRTLTWPFLLEQQNKTSYTEYKLTLVYYVTHFYPMTIIMRPGRMFINWNSLLRCW